MPNRIIGIKKTESDPTEPVTLAQVKTKLRITDSDNDAELTALIKTCRKEVENAAHISIVEKEIELLAEVNCLLRLPYAPVTEVDSVIVYDSSNNEETLVEGDDFQIHSLIDIQSYRDGRHKIVYTVGMEDVPEDLQDIILNVIAIRYEHRGDALNEAKIKETVFELVKPYWIPWI